ncbi:MAG: hypothetical protein ACPHKJ_03710, partial [Litorivicinaceae bacterium]
IAPPVDFISVGGEVLGNYVDIERRQNRRIWLSIEKKIKRELQQLLLRNIIVGKLSETFVSDCHRMDSGYAVCNSDLKNIIIASFY